jgi:putative membrane protein
MTTIPAGFVDDGPEIGRSSSNSGHGMLPEAALPSGPFLLDPGDEPPVRRIDPEWDPQLFPVTRTEPTSIRSFAAGFAVLVGSLLVFSVAEFVERQFRSSNLVGGAAALSIVFGIALLCRGALNEWNSYRALQRVEVLRSALLGGGVELDGLRALCGLWLHSTRRHSIDVGPVLKMLEACSSSAEVRAVLNSRVIVDMQRTAEQAGRRAALKGCALIAVTPSPVLEGVVIALQGMSLLREIASIYGLRPSLIVTYALFSRVASTAVGVTGLDMLTQSISESLLHNLPIGKHFVDSIPGMGLAATRLQRLARVAADACSPLSAKLP